MSGARLIGVELARAPLPITMGGLLKQSRRSVRPSPGAPTYHEQVSIIAPGVGLIDVDEGIAPLIVALCRRGFRTISSCEHQPDTGGLAWVGFEFKADALRFASLCGRKAKVIEPSSADFARAGPGGSTPRGAVGVCFPHGEILSVWAAVEGSAVEGPSP